MDRRRIVIAAVGVVAVRSAREDDIELLRQFGRPAFAYSGATATLLPHIHRTARIVDLYSGITRGYYRDNRRVAPYNLYARTRVLLEQARGASRACDIGFRFGPPPGGKVTRSAAVSYPAASFRFTWSAARGRWLVSMDGTRAVTTDGGRLSPATVVIQHTTVRTSRFLEYGKPPPYAESTARAPRSCCATARPGPRTGRGRPRMAVPRSPAHPASG